VDTLASARFETGLYLRHVLFGLLLHPGGNVPEPNVTPAEPKPIDSWTDDDAQMLIEEGRRQADMWARMLDNLRGRAQFSFTTALALLVGIFAFLRKPHLGPASAVCWTFAVVLTVLSLLGSASVMVSRAEFSMIDATLLTHQTPPLKKTVAAAYARLVRVGGNAFSIRLTIYRDAVWCLLIGAAFYAIAWLTVSL
jgi:hypothetical protein